ncbi:MAG: hypothetical protein V3T77_10595 [Planctomycetota bacterium]
MRLASVLLLLFGLALALGCQTTGAGASTPQVGPAASIPLQALTRDEYVVLDPAVGKATYRSTSIAVAVAGAQNMALYDALSKIPEADFLLTPRFNWAWKESGKSFQVSATVRGKAVRIKTDQELSQAIPAASRGEGEK